MTLFTKSNAIYYIHIVIFITEHLLLSTNAAFTFNDSPVHSMKISTRPCIDTMATLRKSSCFNVLTSSSSALSSLTEGTVDDGNQLEAAAATVTTTATATTPLYMHHMAIRTRNIETAIKFYSLFGYTIEHKFRAGPARAAWLINNHAPSKSKSTSKTTPQLKGRNDIASRLEIIEVPSHILNEKEGTIKRSIDLIQKESLLGLNHYALDVTSYIQRLRDENILSTNDDGDNQKNVYYGLDQFLDHIDEESVKKFGKTLRIAMKPRQQVIGNQVFELAFLYDADGTIIELLRYIKEVDLKSNQTMDSGWEPWDGVGFVQ